MPLGRPQRPSYYYERERKRGRFYSAALHLLFLLFVIVGMPSFMSPPPPEEPAVISVELLPITGISNVKPSTAAPSPEQKPEEQKAEQRKPSPPVKTAEAVPPPPPEKPAEKLSDKAPEPKKEEPKKEEKKKKPKDDDLAAVLRAVKETAQNEKKEDKKKDAKDTSPTKSMSNKFNPDMPMSMSETDAIMSQLAKCWTVPAGAKDAQNLVVVIDAEYDRSGSYISVALAQESISRYDSDTFFRAAADSALRAVKECSPLQSLPLEKYETWHYMELRFDPKFMLN